jgi:hypothetical protein
VPTPVRKLPSGTAFVLVAPRPADVESN